MIVGVSVVVGVERVEVEGGVFGVSVSVLGAPVMMVWEGSGMIVPTSQQPYVS